MPPPLHGERVTLRRFQPSDAADVFAYASDPEVTRFIEWPPHRTIEDSVTYVTRRLKPLGGLISLAIEYRAVGRVIGAVDLRVTSRLRQIAEIGYTIARPFWGQGINVEATQLLIDFAFRELNLRRIQAVCDIDNRRSYRTMEKLGMTRDCVIPNARYRDGTLIDRYRYSILRRDWHARRAQRNDNAERSLFGSG
jgi:ribosomal-protein-alanine N-acetyltransferase